MSCITQQCLQDRQCRPRGCACGPLCLAAASPPVTNEGSLPFPGVLGPGQPQAPLPPWSSTRSPADSQSWEHQRGDLAWGPICLSSLSCAAPSGPAWKLCPVSGQCPEMLLLHLAQGSAPSFPGPCLPCIALVQGPVAGEDSFPGGEPGGRLGPWRELVWTPCAARTDGLVRTRRAAPSITSRSVVSLSRGSTDTVGLVSFVSWS